MARGLDAAGRTETVGVLMGRTKSGFTLIELLVVIAIIAILAAILFPVFANAKEHARMTKCLNNLKNLATAFRMYADDNGGKMPSAHYAWAAPDWSGTVATDSATMNLERGSIWRYTGKNREIYRCPSDVNVAPDSIPTAKNYPLSYSMNWMLGCTASNAACYGRSRVSTDMVRRPSRVLLLIHEGRQNIDDCCFYWHPGNTDKRNKPSKIHYYGTTAAYLDGHAKWVGYDTFIRERDDGSWDPLR